LREPGQPPKEVKLLLGALVLTLLEFLLLGAGRTPLYERFLFTPIALVALLFGFAATFALNLGPRHVIVVAAILGAAAIGLAARNATKQIDRTQAELSIYRDEYRATHALERFVDRADVSSLIRGCGGVAVSPYQARAPLANFLGRQPRDVFVIGGAARVPPRVALVLPADRRVRDILLLLQGQGAGGALPKTLPGFRIALTDANWRVFTRGCGPR
jgi:hypothetical protein